MYVGGTESSRVPVCMSSARKVLRFRYLLETLRGEGAIYCCTLPTVTKALGDSVSLFS